MLSFSRFRMFCVILFFWFWLAIWAAVTVCWLLPYDSSFDLKMCWVKLTLAVGLLKSLVVWSLFQLICRLW